MLDASPSSHRVTPVTDVSSSSYNVGAECVCTLSPCLFLLNYFIGKHLLNSAASLVLDSLNGLCALNPQLALDAPNKSEWAFPNG